MWWPPGGEVSAWGPDVALSRVTKCLGHEGLSADDRAVIFIDQEKFMLRVAPRTFTFPTCPYPLHPMDPASTGAADSPWIQAEVSAAPSSLGGHHVFSASALQRIQAEAERHPLSLSLSPSLSRSLSRPCEPSDGWVGLIGFDPGRPAPRQGSALLQQLESLKASRDLRGFQARLLQEGFVPRQIVLAAEYLRKQQAAAAGN